MIERFSQDTLTWINLKSPTTDEVHTIMEEYELPPGLIGDLTATVPRSYATHQDGVIKVVMDFPVVKRIDAANSSEIKFIIGKHFLVTVQYGEIEAIDQYKKQFEVIATLHRASKKAMGVHLFISLIDELYSSGETKLDYVESIITAIEVEIFRDNERKLVISIAEVTRNLIAFRHVLQVHDDIFRTAIPLIDSIHKHTLIAELEDLRTQYFVLMRRSNSLFESISALHNANTAMLTTKQNEVMKTLTIMAFITFPLTLLSSVFGMNTKSTPIIGQNDDFLIIVSIMAVTTVCFFIFFKYKRWL